MANRETGVVKWFDSAKGYGFISSGEGKDVFVHFRAIRLKDKNAYRSLNEGDKVEFTAKSSDKGRQAEDVVVLEGEEQ